MVDALVEGGIASSKREAREWIKQGSIQVNGDKVTDLEAVLTPENALLANLTLIKKGKRNYYLLEHK